MPRLLAFLPCEKAIISDDNNASIIEILQGFVLPAPPPVGEAVGLPVPWNVFCLWERLDGDESFSFVQRVELLAPDGASLLIGGGESPLVTLRETGKLFHRVLVRVPNFPVRGAGVHTLRLLLKTDNGEFVEQTRFSIPIVVAS